MKMIISRSGLAHLATTGLISVVLFSPALAGELNSKTFLECRSLKEDAARLACYDRIALNATSLPEAVDPRPADPPTAESPASTYMALDDKVGREQLDRDSGVDDQGDRASAVRGHVVDCRPDATGKYLFYFDNGQIWQQKDNTRIRWSECEFDVTIVKDMFGYKMTPEGEQRKIRIGRIR